MSLFFPNLLNEHQTLRFVHGISGLYCCFVYETNAEWHAYKLFWINFWELNWTKLYLYVLRKVFYWIGIFFFRLFHIDTCNTIVISKWFSSSVYIICILHIRNIINIKFNRPPELLPNSVSQKKKSFKRQIGWNDLLFKRSIILIVASQFFDIIIEFRTIYSV